MVLSREIITQIKGMLEKHPEGISITDLVKSVDINRNTAGRYLENLLLSGQVEMRRFGMAKMYTLTKRLPVSSVLSLSSELVMQLDNGLRVFYANDPLLTFLGVQAKDLFGKNIEFSSFSVVFEDVFIELLDRFRKGIRGEEWHGELSGPVQERFFFCRITPTVSSEGKKGVSVLLEDISDRKRDEERIRESEARLRSIFKVSPVGIGVVANRVFMEVNDRFCQMTGYSLSELVGKSVRMLYPSKEAFENAGLLYTNQIQQSGTGSIETPWIKKDGTVIDILLNTTPLDPANIAGGITFTALDITDRKRAEQALRESESTARALLNAPTDTIILMDNRGVILDLNETAVLRLARKREDVVGTLSDTVLPPNLAQERRRKISEVLTTRKPVRFTDESRDTWFDNVAYPILDNQGNVARLAIIARDITDQKRAEDALRESEEKFRALFNNADDMITLHGFDPDGMPGQYLEVNDETCQRLNYTRNELLAMSPKDIVAPESASEIGRNVEKLRKNGHATFEMVHLTKDGQRIPVEVSSHLFEFFGKPRVLALVRNITARKLADQALQESEEKYRNLVEQSLQGLTILQNGRPVFANAAMLEIGGFSYEEYMALSQEELMATVHPGDRDLIRKVMEDRLKGKIFPAENEFRILRKDGQIRWVLTRGMLITYHGAPAIQVAYFDITKRKLAEDALRESEDRYRKLVEISPNAVLLHHDRKIIFANQALARILGVEKSDDLLGRDVLDLIHPAFREGVRANITKDLNGKSSPFMELQMVHADGTLVFVEGQGVGTTIDGMPAVLVAINDITEHHTASLALKESEERYRTLAEASMDLIFLIDRDDRVEYVNSYAAAMLGLPADEVIGKKRSFLFSGELGERQAEGLRRVFETGKTMRSEGAMEIFGSIHWFDHYLMPITDTHGMVTSVLGVSRDITDRKQAEQALRESEAKYRNLMDIAQEGIWIIDPAGITTYVNNKMAEMLGYTVSEMIGSPMYRCMDERGREIAARNYPEYAKGVREQVEFEFVKKDGTCLMAFVSNTSLFDASGKFSGAMAVITDIRDRKRAEQALRESEDRYRKLVEISNIKND
jgi:PAS domain S-box-containing protein